MSLFTSSSVASGLIISPISYFRFILSPYGLSSPLYKYKIQREGKEFLPY